MAILDAPDNDQHTDPAPAQQPDAAPSGDSSSFWSLTGPGWSPSGATTQAPTPAQGRVRDEPEHSQTATDDETVSAPTALATGAMNVPFGRDVATLGVTGLSYAGGKSGEEETGSFGERYNENKRWLDVLAGESARQHPGIYYPASLLPGVGISRLTPNVESLPAAAGWGGLWGGVSGAGEGVTPEERGKNAAESAVGGTILGGAFHGLAQGARYLMSPFRSAEEKATEKVTGPLQADVAAGRGGLTPQDWNTAQQAGYPVTAMDLGGKPTQALARATANMSPEARDILQSTVQARASGQNQRMADLMDQTFGGATGLDTAVARDTILRNGAATNYANYAKAYADPAAQAIWTPQLKQLMQSSQFRSVLSNAQQKAENYAALNNLPPPRNPFVFNPDGTVDLATGPNGQKTIPGLQYWDQVKRSLQDAEGSSINSGNKENAKDWGTLKRSLTGELDAAVPAYAQARQGAFQAFQSENALDAGLNYLKTAPGAKLDAMNQAIAKMTPAEQAEFQRGMAAAVKGKSLSTADNKDLVNQFNSPLTRQKFQTAFGQLGSAKVEASLRWESAMQAANKAVVGNSTTAQQLSDIGVEQSPWGQWGELGQKMRDYAIAGREVAGHTGAAIGAGAAVVSHLYNQAAIKAGANPEVAKFIASNLASGDPAKVNSMLTHIASRPALMKVLQGVENSLVQGSGSGSGAFVGAAGPSGSPPQ
jgi:hypothetical protein